MGPIVRHCRGLHAFEQLEQSDTRDLTHCGGLESGRCGDAAVKRNAAFGLVQSSWLPPRSRMEQCVDTTCFVDYAQVENC